MTLSDLIAAFRLRVDDIVLPYLWSDNEITLYLKEAQNEAAERARLIEDESTSAVTQIAVKSGVATYPLHPSIVDIDRAKLDLASQALKYRDRTWLDRHHPGWQSYADRPFGYFWRENKLTLVFTPIEAGTLRLVVYRLPLNPMSSDGDTPEIAEKHHFRMLDWAFRCAYLKRDTDTFDEKKAAEYEELFIASFGARQDANVQRKQREGRDHTTRMDDGW